MTAKTKVGVFDSGIGGPAVARAIHAELPDIEIVLRDDRAHLPYGSRTVEEIHSFVTPILIGMVNDGCRVIVIACNTVTTNLIDSLRLEINIPLIGLEPAVKPAAEASKSGVIAVCATPRTLSSKRYAELKDKYAKNIKVLEPDCSDWALMIENNRVEREKVAKRINEVLEADADQIVLGCTHYHWIEDQIKELAKGRAEVIQTEAPVVKQLKRVLSQLT
jgi:glutamate racemase